MSVLPMSRLWRHLNFQQVDDTLEREMYKKEHAQATAATRATFLLLHVFILYTLFTCESDLQQGPSLYMRAFFGLLFLNAALYVALNLSDPGFISPTPRSPQPGSQLDESRDLQIQIATKQLPAPPHDQRHPSTASSTVPFDLGSLLEGGRLSHVSTAATDSTTAGQSPTGAQHVLLYVEQRDSADQDAISASTSSFESSARSQHNECDNNPASALLHHLSTSSAQDSAGEPASRSLSLGDDCLAGSSLGSWADELPFSLSHAAEAAASRTAAFSGVKASSEGPSHTWRRAQQAARPVSKLQARSSSTDAEELIPAGRIARTFSDASQASFRALAWYEKPVPGRTCEWCGAWQRLRAHHCSICDRCVDAHDHHCAWIGTCVGLRNRRMFVAFLASQTVLVAWALDAALSCLHNAPAVAREDAFFGYDWRVLASSLLLLVLLVFSGCLLCMQLYLVATAQTSREHSCSAKVAYMAHVPAGVHPFSKGITANVMGFLIGHADDHWELPSIEEMAVQAHMKSDSGPCTCL